MTQNNSASSSLASTSPIFSSYSSEKIAEVAIRVVHELSLSHEDDDLYLDEFRLPNNGDDGNGDEDEDEDEDEDSEFEFAVLSGRDDMSITADEIFDNGRIKPVYYNPDFNKYDSSSSSEEDNDELDGVLQETYCVWTPKKRSEEDGNVALKKKSNSTGTGLRKQWRIKDLLLHKSNSDGKDKIGFLTVSRRREESRKDGEMKRGTKVKVTGAVKGVYGYNGRKKAEGTKKTYLPYKQDLVGIFWFG